MIRNLVFAVVLVAAFAFAAAAQGGRRGEADGRQGRGGGGNRENAVFRTDVPAHDWDIVLGRPTKTSVTASVVVYSDADASIAFGPEKGKHPRTTPVRKLGKGEPAEFVLDGLKPAARYYYVLRAGGRTSEEFSFTTARGPGADFTFAIQADSHLDEDTDVDVYRRSLLNVVNSGADFLVDLGDTFMTDKYPEFSAAASQYSAQRYYFGIPGRFSPIFLALGNHDGENGFRRGEGMYEWSNRMRRKFFPNPVPDEFYNGNIAGAQNYYAWEWGDAQFIVLDPFTYTTTRPRGESDGNWNWTLGREQYDWLAATLEKSRARLRFVFIHHLVGGRDRVARGGAEAVPFWEWGGRGIDAADIFASRRGGFRMPIHQLLVKHGVAVVFHGHDHLYVKQDLDGIVYQEVPQPGHRQADNIRSAAEYGYESGVVRGSSGVLIVRVKGGQADVDYVRSFPENRREGRRDGLIEHSYRITK